MVVTQEEQKCIFMLCMEVAKRRYGDAGRNSPKLELGPSCR